MMRQVSPDPKDCAAGSLYFSVSIRKLVVMSVATFGFYQLYWFYRNWKAIQEQTGAGFSPFWRAFFTWIWCPAFLDRVNESAAAHGSEVRYAPVLMTGVWFGLRLCSRLPHPFWLLYFLSVVPLALVQTTCNELNRIVTPQSPVNDRFTVANTVGIALGVVYLVFSLIRGYSFGRMTHG